MLAAMTPTSSPNAHGRPPRIALVGAGSVVFTRELLGDILGYPELTEATISLHDIDADRLATAELMAHRTAEQLQAHPVIRASADRAAALEGADFVVNMVAVGGHDATLTDFGVPASFGVRQTIGDTLGVGGIFRALRTFPVLDGIARDMADVCPDALLLNYTNPMSMNVRYLSAAHPNITSIGLCHSVFWTVHGLCEVIDVPMDDVEYAAAGVNHQAWLLRWERAGESLYPALDAAIAADPELRRRVRVDMYRRLGFYPTETSEHSSEYTPWYLRSDDEVARLRIPIDDYVGISAGNVAEYEQTKAALAVGEPLQIGGEGEYAPEVIHSVTTGQRRMIHANVANQNLISNLPAGAGVEVPAVVDALGVRPLSVGALPPQCAALNRAFLNVGELTVTAALNDDPRAIRQAAMLDPSTAAQVDVDTIWDLCNAMVRAHGERLPPALRATLSL
jgi:alpha-galactosidase